MDPLLKIVMKLDSASNYIFGTDEELFSSAIDDLLAMPGSYEDNLKSLNSLIATHTNKQYSTEDGKYIDVPVFNAKSLDSLIDDEMSGEERAKFRKKAGFDHEVRVKNNGRRNRIEKKKGFLNLDKPAPDAPAPDAPAPDAPDAPDVPAAPDAPLAPDVPDVLNDGSDVLNDGRNKELEDAQKNARKRREEQEKLTNERNEAAPEQKPKPVDIENPAPVEPAQPVAQPEIDYDAALPGSKEAGNIIRGERYKNRSREATHSPMTEDAKFLGRAAETAETQESNRRLSRQSIRNSYGDEMRDWVDSNYTPDGKPLNELAATIKAKHGLDPEQWNDGVKNSFVRNYNSGNHIRKESAFKDPMSSMVPHYDENGPTGNMTTKKQMRQDLGQKKGIRFDESLPLTREQQMMQDIQEEQKRFNGNLFGPEAQESFRRETKGYTPEEYYDLNRRAQARATTDLNSNMAEAFLPQDFNSPTPGKATQGPSQPLNESFTPGGVVDNFKSSTANLMNEESEATNSVLDNVPMPQMPNTSFKPPSSREVPSNNNISTLPFSLDKIEGPANKKAERRAAADQEYSKWQSRYGEKSRERKALMDQRMRDRQQRINADRLSRQAQSAPRPGQGIF